MNAHACSLENRADEPILRTGLETQAREQRCALSGEKGGALWGLALACTPPRVHGSWWEPRELSSVL